MLDFFFQILSLCRSKLNDVHGCSSTTPNASKIGPQPLRTAQHQRRWAVLGGWGETADQVKTIKKNYQILTK